MSDSDIIREALMKFFEANESPAASSQPKPKTTITQKAVVATVVVLFLMFNVWHVTLDLAAWRDAQALSHEIDRFHTTKLAGK